MSKNTILNIMKSGKTFIGQQLGNTPSYAISGYGHFINDLYTETGQYPAIIGSGYWGDGISELNQLARDYYNNGGLLALYLRLNNPWNGGRYSSLYRTRLIDLITPTSDVYSTWQNMLDTIIDGLLEISDMPVLFRPLHEMNYARSSWWCAQNWWDHPELRERDISDYVQLWRHMHTKFTQAGLTNLIWVYGTANRIDPPASAFFPGSEFVDLAGPSVYDGNLISNYNSPAYLVYAENGNQSGVAEDLMEWIPQFESHKPGYVLRWSSWSSDPIGTHCALIDNLNCAEFMNSDKIVTRGELVNLQKSNEISSIASEMASISTRLNELQTRLLTFI